MTLNLISAAQQIAAAPLDNMRGAIIDCPDCGHRKLVTVADAAPDELKCPQCGAILYLENRAELETEPPPGWIPKSPAATLAHAEEIIAARLPVTGKRVVMATSLTRPPRVDEEWLASLDTFREIGGDELAAQQAALDKRASEYNAHFWTGAQRIGQSTPYGLGVGMEVDD